MAIDPRFLAESGPQVFTGNELLVKGALEVDGGVHLLTGYPGSPVAGFFDTLAAAVWDDERLHVGFWCEEPFPEAHVTERDGIVFAESDVELFIDVDPALWIAGDAFLLQRALSNLVLNAIDFAPPESAVTIDAHAVRGRVDVTVRDRGPGIPPRDRERLFRRFVRLGATPTGGETSTGLGLALAKQRARAMGGDLWYEDRPGGGASFVFELPLARASGG